MPHASGDLSGDPALCLTNMASETTLLNRIRQAASRLSARVFRNNVGVAKYPSGHTVVYGLHPGSSDLIGWTTIEVTPSMVGRRVAVFTSLELKQGSGRTTPEQDAWLRAVREAGGIAAVVRSVEDAESAITHGV